MGSPCEASGVHRKREDKDEGDEEGESRGHQPQEKGFVYTLNPTGGGKKGGRLRIEAPHKKQCELGGRDGRARDQVAQQGGGNGRKEELF